jgi:hypothetical protein
MLILIFLLAQTGRIATRKYAMEVAGYGSEAICDPPAENHLRWAGMRKTIRGFLLFFIPGSYDPCAVFSHGPSGVCFADLDSIDIITAFDIHIESE